jgi:hypothetical protein
MSPMVERRSVPRLAENLFAKLAVYIKRGEFTPFLGAGASSLREANQVAPPWNRVLENIGAIMPHLKTKEGQHFLSSFAAQRLTLSAKDLEQELIAASAKNLGDESSFHKNGLLHLQVELINATVRLTEYFGRVFSDETPPIRELASCSVPFDPADLNGADAIKQLLKAAAIAHDLLDDASGKRESPFLLRSKGTERPIEGRSIELQRIYEKILILLVTLLGDKRDLYGSELERHKFGERLPIPDEVDEGQIADFGRLRFDALHWMSELIWYTLRYWIPCYPTTAELAFELSLRVPKAPPRRPELAQAAQALENEYAGSQDGSLTDEMAHIVRYCERYQESEPESVVGTSAFYCSIALAMSYQFELYIESPNDDFELEETDGDAGERRNGEATVPLVFSTNFDNALERVFDRHDIGYHVVYPMIAEGSRNETVPVGWRMKTCYPESAQKEPSYSRWDGMPPAKPTGSPKPGQLIGPMILKLHGAPCIKDNRPGYKHWLVLSETGYLEALATASHVPDWVLQQLGHKINSRRALWFLGYSMSDWNVRLRLFEHCMGGTQSFRGTVDREGDVYRRALLLTEKIHVEQWYADLSFLPQRILELFARDQTRDLTAGNVKLTELVKELQRLLADLEKRRRR